jgi:hypothetical protein
VSKWPPPLNVKEQANVLAALHFLHAKIGSWARVAKIVKNKRSSLRRARAGQRIRGMRGLARRISAVVGVPVGDVLAGRFPPPGTCPHCGR